MKSSHPLQILVHRVAERLAFSALNGEAESTPRRLNVAALEPRILFSGAPVAAPVEAPAAAPAEAAPAAQVAPAAAPAEAAPVAEATVDQVVVAAPEAAVAVAAAEETAPAPADASGDTAITLSQAELGAVAEAAAQRWISTGLTAEQTAVLSSISYSVADLGSNYLGLTSGTSITIDDDASGSGAYFIDDTPFDDSEFGASGAGSGSGAQGKYDLLTILLHEQGHILGLDDIPAAGNPGDVMINSLTLGQRRAPLAGQALGAEPGSLEGEHYMFAGTETFETGETIGAQTFSQPGGPVFTATDDLIVDSFAGFGSGSSAWFLGTGIPGTPSAVGPVGSISAAGNSFVLNSIDVAVSTDDGNTLTATGDIRFVGTLLGGGTVSETFTITSASTVGPATATYQTVVFGGPLAAAELTSLSFEILPGIPQVNYIALDNIDYVATPIATNLVATSLANDESLIINTGGTVISAVNFGVPPGNNTVDINGITHAVASAGNNGDGADLIPELTTNSSFDGDYRNSQATSSGYTGDMHDLMSGIAGIGAPGPVTLDIAGLTVGQDYLFQGYWEANNFNQTASVTFEGTDTLGGITGDGTNGVLISYTFTAGDTVLNAGLSKTGGSDNIWWQGYSLQAVPNVGVQAGDVIKLDFSTAGDGDGGSLADWNQVSTGVNTGGIAAGAVVRHGDGAVVEGVDISFTNLIANNFNNDGASGGWGGTATDPYYIPAADDIYFHGSANDFSATFGGLDPSLTYNVRIHSLIGNAAGSVERFVVSDGAGTQTSEVNRGTRFGAATLEDGQTVFTNVTLNASNEIVVTIEDVSSAFYPLNAIVIEAVEKVPVQAGDVIKLDFSTAGDGDGGSLADWNQVSTGVNTGGIADGGVVRHGDGSVVDGATISFTNLIANNFNNDGASGGWGGTATDPYYIPAADDIYFHGSANDFSTTFGGLDPSLTYNVRIHSLIGNAAGSVERFVVSDGTGTQTSEVNRGTRFGAATLEDGQTVFTNVTLNASNEIVVTIEDVSSPFYPLNAIVIEAVGGGFEAVDDNYSTGEDTPLVVAAPGVLGNDNGGADPAVVTFDPTSANGVTVNVNPDGSFTYDATGSAAVQALNTGDSIVDTFTYTAVGTDPLAPIHRYSFDGTGGNGAVLVDSIGGADGVLREADGVSVLSGGELVLGGGSGNTAGYGDLPNGLISSLEDVTIEGWVTVDGNQNWARIFDFGSSQGTGEITGPGDTNGGGNQGLDYFMTSASRGGNSNDQRTTFRNADPVGGGNALGNGEQAVDTSIVTTFGQEFHFAVTFDGDGTDDSPATLTYFRDGVQVGQRNDIVFELSNINDINNWLGRSNWGGDANMQGSFNEFRIYDRALDAAQVADSFAAGADVSFNPVPIHQYSFDGTGGNGAVLVDSIGGADGVLREADGVSVLSGGELVLGGGSGNTAGYGDLPNGLISSLEDVTIEGWVTVDGNQNWARIFDFGSSQGTGEITGPGDTNGGGNQGLDYFMTSASRGGNSNDQRTTFRNADPVGGGNALGNGEQAVDTSIVTTFGQEFHFAVTFDGDGTDDSPATLTYFRDGVQVGQRNDIVFELSNINDINNWLGRSNWGGDANMQGSFNEFRIYDQALTASQVASSFASGSVINFNADTATVTVTVTGANDAPDASDDANSIFEAIDGDPAVNTVTGDVLANDNDVDNPNGDLRLTQVQSAASGVDTTGTIAGAYGILTWTPNANGNGTYVYTLDDENPAVQALLPGDTLADTFTYTVGDGADTSTADLLITILGADDSPIARDDFADVVEDTVLSASGNLITDPSGPGISINFANNVNGGAFNGQTLNVTGAAGAVPLTNWNNLSSNNSGDGSATNLLDSSGTATPAGVSWTSNNTWGNGGWTDDGGNGSIFGTYLDTGAADNNGVDITVSDLPAAFSDGYDVFIYFDGDASGRFGEYVVTDSNGHTLTQIGNDNNASTTMLVLDDGSFASNGNYLRFSGYDGTSSLMIHSDSVTPANGNGTRAGINGIQIVPVGDTNLDGTGLRVTGIDGTTDPNTDVTGTYGSLDWETDGSYTYNLDNGTDGVSSVVQNLAAGEVVTDVFTYTLEDNALPKLADPSLIHRYSFDGTGGDGAVLVDSIGGADGVLRASDGSQLSGGQLTLGGGSSATAGYGDLPNGLISGLTDLTIEGWATVDSSQNWQRLYSFGSTNIGEITGVGGGHGGNDVFMLSANRGGNVNQQRVEIRNTDPVGGTSGGSVLDADDPTALGQEFYFAVTYDADANGGTGQLTYYREVTPGDVQIQGVLNTDPGFQLSGINDVNNWLGRSQWSGDANLDGSFNEFRIYNKALTAGEVAESFGDGADVKMNIVPIHQYSFSETGGTTFADSIGSADLTLIDAPLSGTTGGGGGHELTGTEVRLFGGPNGGNNGATPQSDFIKIPDGTISSLSDATFELWATEESIQNWSRILSFGSTTDDLLLWSWTTGTNPNESAIRWNDQGVGDTGNLVFNPGFVLGTENHLALTVDEGGGAGGNTRLTAYVNGIEVATADTPNTLSDLNDVNSWLGRSKWAGDNTADASFNEFRIYDQALTATQVVSSFNSGSEVRFNDDTTATAELTVTVTGVNDAPVLDDMGVNDFGAVSVADTMNDGDLVSDLLNGATTDVDNGALDRGIAITGVTVDAPGTGKFQYMTGGGMWTDIPAVTDDSALLLLPTDAVRFVPDGTNFTGGKITYRAWDQSSGTAGSLADADPNGGTTAFSLVAAESSVAVVNVVIDGDEIIYTAASGQDNDIQVSMVGGMLTITDANGHPIGTGEADGNPDANGISIAYGGQDLTIETGDMDDGITFGDMTGFTGSLTADGGTEFDTITTDGSVLMLAVDENVDLDAERVRLLGSTISTTGDGTISIDGTGGGSAAVLGIYEGVKVKGTSLSTENGAITVNGTGGDDATGNEGIQLSAGSSIMATGAGSVTLAGQGGTGGSSNTGVSIIEGSTVSSGAAGGVTVTGTGGGERDSQAVNILHGSTVSGGAGGVMITGTADGTGVRNDGVYTTSSTISASDGGSVTITGTASQSAASGANAIGVRISAGTTVEVTGGGSITLTGTGGTGTSGNEGVHIGQNSALGTEAGDITITGTSSATGANNYGVHFLGGSSAMSGGALTVTGTGGNGNYGNAGVSLLSTMLTSATLLSVTGTGQGTGWYNHGIIGSGSTVTGGTGVALVGTGSQNSTTGYNDGVSLSGTSVTATGGTLAMTGIGGTGGSANNGVKVTGGSLSGVLDIDGTGGGGSGGNSNAGVKIAYADLTGVTGGTIDGTGGMGNFYNYGAVLYGNMGGDAATATGTAGQGAASDATVGDFFNFLPALLAVAAAEQRSRKAILGGLVARLSGKTANQFDPSSVEIYREADGLVGLDPTPVSLESLQEAGVSIPATPEGTRAVILLTGEEQEALNGFVAYVDASGGLVSSEPLSALAGTGASAFLAGEKSQNWSESERATEQSSFNEVFGL